MHELHCRGGRCIWHQELAFVAGSLSSWLFGTSNLEGSLLRRDWCMCCSHWARSGCAVMMWAACTGSDATLPCTCYPPMLSHVLKSRSRLAKGSSGLLAASVSWGGSSLESKLLFDFCYQVLTHVNVPPPQSSWNAWRLIHNSIQDFCLRLISRDPVTAFSFPIT